MEKSVFHTRVWFVGPQRCNLERQFYCYNLTMFSIVFNYERRATAFTVHSRNRTRVWLYANTSISFITLNLSLRKYSVQHGYIRIYNAYILSVIGLPEFCAFKWPSDRYQAKVQKLYSFFFLFSNAYVTEV